ncbi:metallophosphoesterase [Crenobacter sp. SG2303]|uniref:Metallophosphoesterase n=2 Tax=Crenobacter oryzisoli TaxID=3056844 RepID=A0ABT7XUN6_9NEIS|nr:metallophosphoesterase [Crenobacter sp. SG2303]
MSALIGAGRAAILISMLALLGHASAAATIASSIGEDPVVLAAGDIAQCPGPGAALTAHLLAGLTGIVLAVGDLAYERGSLDEFDHCYEPTWGAYKARTFPVPGNHEYETPNAAGYFAYWGDRAGPVGKGYYSVDLGTWHLIALNSNLESTAALEQENWLRNDLAASPARCVLAFWHHTVFSSGYNGQIPATLPLYRVLYEGGASVLITGHDHHYERFQPLAPNGIVDETHGIRIFVVGTGGAKRYPALFSQPASEVRSWGTWGILKIVLHPASYHWEFIPAERSHFSDAGDGRCVERETGASSKTPRSGEAFERP